MVGKSGRPECNFTHRVLSYTQCIILHSFAPRVKSNLPAGSQFMLFCREATVVANLRTFTCKISQPQIAVV